MARAVDAPLGMWLCSERGGEVSERAELGPEMDSHWKGSSSPLVHSSTVCKCRRGKIR